MNGEERRRGTVVALTANVVQSCVGHGVLGFHGLLGPAAGLQAALVNALVEAAIGPGITRDVE